MGPAHSEPEWRAPKARWRLTYPLRRAGESVIPPTFPGFCPRCDQDLMSAVCAVHGAHHRAQRGGHDVGVDADAPQLYAIDLALHVGGGLGVAAGAARVLH